MNHSLCCANDSGDGPFRERGRIPFDFSRCAASSCNAFSSRAFLAGESLLNRSERLIVFSISPPEWHWRWFSVSLCLCDQYCLRKITTEQTQRLLSTVQHILSFIITKFFQKVQHLTDPGLT